MMSPDDEMEVERMAGEGGVASDLSLDLGLDLSALAIPISSAIPITPAVTSDAIEGI